MRDPLEEVIRNQSLSALEIHCAIEQYVHIHVAEIERKGKTGN